MSARRYTGSLTLRVSCLDNGAMSRPPIFRVSAAEDGRHLGSTTVQAAPAEAGRCVDDPTLLDEIAHAGVSFLYHDQILNESHTGYPIRRSRTEQV